MIHIGLFEGIGGFGLAAHWAGWKTYATCEINPFGRRVLEHYWPEAYHHGDIKTLDYGTIDVELSKRFGEKWRDDEIIVTGGFPCQPFSVAGQRKGTEDDRHLWPEMLRVVREVGPDWVVGENVLGIVNWSGGLVFEQVQSDLEAEGYEVQPYVLPACGVNAPHRRDRVWFVAYSESNRNRRELFRLERQDDSKWKPEKCRENDLQYRDNGKVGTTPDTMRRRQPGEKHGEAQPRFFAEEGFFDNWRNFPTQPPVRRGNDGLSESMVRAYFVENSGGVLTEKEIDRLVQSTFSKFYKEAIKSFGNAIVPQVAYQIFRAINEYTIYRNESRNGI